MIVCLSKNSLALLGLSLVLSACTTPRITTPDNRVTLDYRVYSTAAEVGDIDKTINAIGQERRIQFLVLHYTAIDEPASLRVLSQQQVSSHYLVGDKTPVKVWQLVDETNMAYHAGVSDWRGYNRLNASSIGIEIVNLGYRDNEQGRQYFPFPQEQIDKVLALTKDIVKRHNIKPENVVGHSDIAPTRKSDPGPLFPWKQFADAGLILWPDAIKVAERLPQFEQSLPDALWFQKKLAHYGYFLPQTGSWDELTKNVLIAFQTKYRPARFDGQPDAETAAMLDVLSELLPTKK